MTTRIALYIDYKSPYAYLAKDGAYALEREFALELDWLPYTLDIPSYLGSARVAEDGTVLEEERTPHQWRRVRYSYMDVRRYANLRGLTIRGTQKIWDSSLAAIGLLWTKRGGGDVFRRYNDMVYERFWKRELDIEDRGVIRDVVVEAGGAGAGFLAFADGEGRAEHDRIRAEAEEMGVFGVPTFVVDGELFWGRQHLDLIRARLGGGAPAAGTVTPPK